MKAIIPRRGEIDQIIANFQQRIRRLEVNRFDLTAATAIYYKSQTPGAYASTYTLGFSSATPLITDRIGLGITSTGIVIPAGWVAMVEVTLTLDVNSAARAITGDNFDWFSVVGANIGGGSVEHHIYPTAMFTTFQQLAMSFPAAAASGGNGLDVKLGTLIQTNLGTTFKPLTLQVMVVGLKMPQSGFPSNL